MEHTESWVDGVVAQLLSGGPRAISLDEVGEALGDRAVSADEVERLLQCLEAAGARLEEPASKGLAPLLRQVISCARALQQEGQSPSPSLIAQRSGLSVREVRVALLYFDVIKAGK